MPDEQLDSGRTFACAHCHSVVLVCSYCDWGRRYCSEPCRDQSRRIKQRMAGKLYQSTETGRCAHARRQQRYKKRSIAKQMTHHPCPQEHGGDVLALGRDVAQGATCHQVVAPLRCHWCGRSVAKVVRSGFLRHAGAPNDPLAQWFGGLTRGQSP